MEEAYCARLERCRLVPAQRSEASDKKRAEYGRVEMGVARIEA